MLPVSLALLRCDDGAWVLVDAGFAAVRRQDQFVSQLLDAVRATIPAGDRLAAIARKSLLAVCTAEAQQCSCPAVSLVAAAGGG